MLKYIILSFRVLKKEDSETYSFSHFIAGSMAVLLMWFWTTNVRTTPVAVLKSIDFSFVDVLNPPATSWGSDGPPQIERQSGMYGFLF